MWMCSPYTTWWWLLWRRTQNTFFWKMDNFNTMFKKMDKLWWKWTRKRDCLAEFINPPSELQHGWVISNDALAPLWMTQPRLPPTITEAIKCNCKTGCSSGRCSCKQSNRQCTIVCGCTNCQNGTEVQRHENEESDDDDRNYDDGSDTEGYDWDRDENSDGEFYNWQFDYYVHYSITDMLDYLMMYRSTDGNTGNLPFIDRDSDGEC